MDFLLELLADIVLDVLSVFIDLGIDKMSAKKLKKDIIRKSKNREKRKNIKHKNKNIKRKNMNRETGKVKWMGKTTKQKR